MKNLASLFILGIVIISTNSFGQTSEKKNNFSIGGGKEAYNGDLGNAWFKPEEEWYGFVSLRYSHYLNKSFDVTASLTHGDYGHCRESDEERFRDDGTEVLNMLSRLTSGVLLMKYKIANGYMINENAKFAPYIYLGGGVNNISNHWWKDKNRVNTGNYGSINGGLGLSYNFYKNLSFTYNLGFGYYSSDNIDRRIDGSNDMFMQHSFLVGVNF
jgi:hypothetical protein